jgi:hypothetical protein
MFEEIVECTLYADQNSSMGTIVQQGISVVIRKASNAIPLKTSPEQPHAHSSTAYRPAECGLIASRTARSRHATSEFSQSAYQIEVASTPANLAADKADWSAQWIGDPLPSVDNIAATTLRHRGAAGRRMVRGRDRTGAGAHWQAAQHLRRSSAFPRPTMKGNAAVFTVQSGRYSFVAR